MGKQLILSTGNPNKVEEIKNIFKNFEINIVSKKDLGLGDLEIKETGDTLKENAIIKASALS
ncbi:MAG: non-canonical purine NTP pyrophosphatase, partial [Tissierellia bacterium]|nr:non-canonical purine NTP pyrophosphatase [Tissierellia bacterium]